MTLTLNEKKAYKVAETDKALRFSDIRIDIKGYETDGTKDYVIIDVDPDNDDVNTIVTRRLYTAYGNEYFTYKGMSLYLYDFSRIL